MKSVGRFLIGLMFFLSGIFLLLVALGVITSFFFFDVLRTFWPLGIVFSGVLILLKQRLFAVFFLLFSVVIGIFFTFVPQDFDTTLVFEHIEERFFSNISFVEYHVSFGVTDFSLNRSVSGNLFDFDALTFSQNTFDSNVLSEGNVTKVFLTQRSNFSFSDFFHINDDKDPYANLSIYPNVSSKVFLDYGVVDAIIDLKEVQVDELVINSGVSDSTIFFNSYPTAVFIDTGVSDVDFVFPSDFPVMIDVEGGIVDSSFPAHFIRVGSKAYTPNFNASLDHIFIDVDAGVSDISGRIQR